MMKTYTVGHVTYGITDDHLTILRMNGEETKQYPYSSISIGAGKSGSEGPYYSIDIIDRTTGEVLDSVPNDREDFDSFAEALVQEHFRFNNGR